MWTEVLLPAQCLVMGGRGALRPHSAAERSAHTTWKSAVSVHLRLLVGGIASSEPLGVGCAREPATVRVLSVNSRRLVPTATRNAPATGVEFSAVPVRLGRSYRSQPITSQEVAASRPPWP